MSIETILSFSFRLALEKSRKTTLEALILDRWYPDFVQAKQEDFNLATRQTITVFWELQIRFLLWFNKFAAISRNPNRLFKKMILKNLK